MASKKADKKESDLKTELVKEEENPKRNYIFQDSGITKKGLYIIIAFLVVIFIALAVSGILFGGASELP